VNTLESLTVQDFRKAQEALRKANVPEPVIFIPSTGEDGRIRYNPVNERVFYEAAKKGFLSGPGVPEDTGSLTEMEEQGS
jgi:hypothetical protein